MSEKHEFASPGWFRALRETIVRLVCEAGPEFAEVRWSVCEVFTNVPEHLAPGPERRIAWHCRIRDGEVEFALTEIDGADFKVVADYQTVLPLARLHLGNDPSVEARVNEMLATAAVAGKIRIEGSRDTRPEALATLHDEMVRVTA